jgi:hypothetical protein
MSKRKLEHTKLTMDVRLSSNLALKNSTRKGKQWKIKCNTCNTTCCFTQK